MKPRQKSTANHWFVCFNRKRFSMSLPFEPMTLQILSFCGQTIGNM